ncbi:ATP-binding cassette subfamily G member 4-like [Planococcus citri]|uniref:ATP-binding cassette subfamily G member 4-like n=1 Tax=Planococcus citri TaxID=170843 RepID=UPI0031F9B5BC
MSSIDLDCFNDESDRIKLPKKQETVDIHFEDISYTAVRRSFDFWRCEKKDILKNVNGDFQSRKLTGIIGPSGSGKTTLLDIVSGYRLRGVSGYVYVNGGQRNIKKLIKQSCYIMQDDKLQQLITVHEAMTFVSNVKLDVSVTRNEKQSKIAEILKNLSLSECHQTLTKNLSGGERKRLAIALELISNPPVLFLDEPTTGLDSKAARQCLEVLQNLAFEGRTVICTIHQPSALLLNMLHNIYVLSNGYCIYQGTVNNLLAYLSSNNFICPVYYNPVEYVIELCVLGSSDYTETLKDAIRNGKSQEWLDSPACWSNIPLNTLNLRAIQRNELENDFRYATSLRTQISHLLNRILVTSLRNQFLTRLRMSINISVGVVLGLFFRNIGKDAAQTSNNFNLLFFCLLFVMFNALTSKIITFPDDLPVIRREHFNRWYSLKAYFISTTLGDAPIQVISTTIFISLVYVLSGQPLDWWRIIMFLTIINLIALLFQDYGILVGTLLSVENGLIFGLFTISPWVMFSGFFLYYRDAEWYFQWLYDISVLRHGLEGLSIAVYGYGRRRLPCSKIFCYHISPKEFLQFVDIKECTSILGFNIDRYLINLVYILILFLVVKMTCYFVLRRKLRS